MRRILSSDEFSDMNSKVFPIGNTILEFLMSHDLETPAVFTGDIEEGEILRMEWLTPNSHTVFAITEDMTFYGFYLNVEVEDTFSFESNPFEEAEAFFAKYVPSSQEKEND